MTARHAEQRQGESRGSARRVRDPASRSRHVCPASHADRARRRRGSRRRRAARRPARRRGRTPPRRRGTKPVACRRARPSRRAVPAQACATRAEHVGAWRQRQCDARRANSARFDSVGISVFGAALRDGTRVRQPALAQRASVGVAQFRINGAAPRSTGVAVGRAHLAPPDARRGRPSADASDWRGCVVRSSRVTMRPLTCIRPWSLAMRAAPCALGSSIAWHTAATGTRKAAAAPPAAGAPGPRSASRCSARNPAPAVGRPRRGGATPAPALEKSWLGANHVLRHDNAVSRGSRITWMKCASGSSAAISRITKMLSGVFSPASGLPWLVAYIS